MLLAGQRRMLRLARRVATGTGGRATPLKAAAGVAAEGAVYSIEGGVCDYQQTVFVELRIAGARG